MLPGKTYRPEDVLRIAARRKWLIVCPAAAALALAVLLAQLVTSVYRSETVILLVPQRVPEGYVRSTVTTRIESQLTSISQQIQSRTHLERIINDFKLFEKERQTIPMELVVDRMRGDIRVEVITADTFNVTYESSSPQTAMAVTNRLASLFIEENLRNREVVAEHTSEFLEAQLQEARRRLVEHEKKLETYREAHAGQLPSQQDANLQAIANIQMQLQSLAESLYRDRDRRLSLQRIVVDSAGPAQGAPRTTVTQDGVVASRSTAEQLDLARSNLRELELRYTAEHPDVLKEKNHLAGLEQKVIAEAAGRRSGTPPVGPRVLSEAEAAEQRRQREAQAELRGLERQIASKEADERRLRGQIATYQLRLDAAPRRESELVELTRDYDTLRSLYTSLLVKREESRISANLERKQIGEQFRVLDPARLPERPIKPNRLRFYLIGALLGLGLGLALTAWSEYRDTSLRTEEDVLLALQLPVVATIPVITRPTGRHGGLPHSKAGTQ